MQLGRIGGADAEMVARVLVGAVTSIVFLETFEGYSMDEGGSGAQLGKLVDAIWHGMAPEGPRSE